MNREEINKELSMTYEGLTEYLIQKYGAVQYDYFCTSECRSKNKKVTRTSEGLYCHHIDEDKGDLLSHPKAAQRSPFDWQMKERLVYCNALEHLILHIKIAVLRQKKKLIKPLDIDAFLRPGIHLICGEINDMFLNEGTKIIWKKRCFEEIKENYEDYIDLIQALIGYIEDNFGGEKKKGVLHQGGVIHFSDGDCTITKVSNEQGVVQARCSSGEEKAFRIDVLRKFDFLTYEDHIDIAMRNLASGYGGFYSRIYEDIKKNSCKKNMLGWKQLLKIDYIGYGYLQYADIQLEKGYGSDNADEYISKALPMYSLAAIDLKGKTVKFWKEKEIPEDALKTFYIVRISASFCVKKGKEAFVRYRGRYKGINEKHNYRKEGWTVLEASEITVGDKTIDFPLTLSLGRDDFLLFKKNYIIKNMKILDGCYFI